MLDRTQDIPAYIVMTATACAGVAGAPFWTALLGGAALAVFSIREQRKFIDRFAAIGAGDVLLTAHVASAASSCAAAAVAFAVGRLAFWAFAR